MPNITSHEISGGKIYIKTNKCFPGNYSQTGLTEGGLEA